MTPTQANLMTLLSSLFGSPQARSQRNAAKAASALRQQAARDLSVEVSVLIRYFNAAVQLHQKVYAAGNMDLAGRYVDSLSAPRELLERIDRVGPELESEIAMRTNSASSVSDWENLASFEVELRSGFIKMRETAKQFATELGKLNSEAGQFLRSGA